MKHLVALMIRTASALICTWTIGYTARGPYADKSIGRDLATGTAIVGGVAAIHWADRELSRDKAV